MEYMTSEGTVLTTALTDFDVRVAQTIREQYDTAIRNDDRETIHRIVTIVNEMTSTLYVRMDDWRSWDRDLWRSIALGLEAPVAAFPEPDVQPGNPPVLLD